MRYSAAVAPASFALALAAILGACTDARLARDAAPDPTPRPLAPIPIPRDGAVPSRQPVIDLTQPDAVVRGSAPAVRFDSRLHPNPIQEPDPVALPRRIREVLPPHPTAPAIDLDAPNALPVGGSLDEHRTSVVQTWPSIGATGWNPPDPTLAVGPNHVLATVNMQIAWYSKSGQVQFSVPLNDTGNPGFFETVGARGFTFDPKCLYDHLAQRFVVIAPEVYSSTGEAYICIAISDDSDPNGVWFKYRTDAVITVGTDTYWWDYPGFGYDANAYYVTSNLFGLNISGFGGTGFRIFDKTPLLTGQPAQFSTLRQTGAASVQVAQHFGANLAPFFVSINSSSSLRIRAITNPLTNPVIVSTNVTVPSFAGPVSGPTPGGTLSLVDNRIMNVHWRDGNLYACHNTSLNNRNLARWYHLRTNNWPVSGGPTLAQSGSVDAGPGLHSYFPAIYSNSNGDVGVVVGVSSPTLNAAVAVAARRSTDPLNRMGVPEIVKFGDTGSNGRWGDYFDIAVDPTDDTTFWVIGQYQQPSGWNNWITSFAVADDPVCHPVPDDAGQLESLQQRAVDVLANDWHSTNLPLTIQSFQPTSQRGGSIIRSVGTGPGGRDRLLYTAPANFNGTDSFTYTVADANNQTATAAVSAFVTDPSTYRPADLPLAAGVPGVDVDYYALLGPTVLPDFSLLTPYAADVVPAVDFASTDQDFATSARADNVGAVFRGYIAITSPGYYTLGLTSDDGSRLFLGDTLFINNDGTHGMVEATNSVGLQPGLHRVRIDFFEAGGGAGLTLAVGPFGGTRTILGPASWRRLACAPDFNQDGNVDQDDIACLAQVVAGDPSCSTLDPDFNQDGNVDQSDIAALEQVIAGAPCP
ncbi:MAG: PA14 domain-containing protein [Planctomycetota bacterium]|nr:PA14 domain-containing protein [Planctomycetota bacterium]